MPPPLTSKDCEAAHRVVLDPSGPPGAQLADNLWLLAAGDEDRRYSWVAGRPLGLPTVGWAVRADAMSSVMYPTVPH